MVLIPDRFQIPERDAAITTRAQSSLESFQKTGNHTKFPVLYILKLTKHVCWSKRIYTCIYTHIKAILKVDGSFLFSLLKDIRIKITKRLLDLQDLTTTIYKQKQQFYSQVIWGTVIGWCWPGRVFLVGPGVTGLFVLPHSSLSSRQKVTGAAMTLLFELLFINVYPY